MEFAQTASPTDPVTAPTPADVRRAINALRAARAASDATTLRALLEMETARALVRERLRQLRLVTARFRTARVSQRVQ